MTPSTRNTHSSNPAATVNVSVGQEHLQETRASNNGLEGTMSEDSELSDQLSDEDGSSVSTASNGVSMDEDEIMEDVTENAVVGSNSAPHTHQQLHDATLVHGFDNKPMAVLDDALSLEQIEKCILECDKRIAQLVVQITQSSQVDPVRADELGLQHDIQYKDRQRFAETRKSIVQGRELSWLSSKVPANLPRIQWEHHCFDRSAEVFADISDALRKFKDILVMNGLNPDYHWRRLIPASLGPDHRSWLDELPKKVKTWKEFCEEFQGAFGSDQEDEKVQASVCNLWSAYS